MVQRGHLSVPVIGVAKSGWTLDQLKERARASLTEHGGVDEDAFRKLSGLLRYIDGDYADPATFQKLRQALGPAKHPTHYLAIPPSLFGAVIEALGKSGCADGARVVIEKPFGHDLASARELNATLHSVFPEPASSASTTTSARRRSRTCSSSDSPTRSSSRSGTATTWTASRSRWRSSSAFRGAASSTTRPATIRDVIQNHLLQVVGYLAMEPPNSVDADRVRDEQVKVFRAIPPLKPEDVVRGQFDGYRKEPGVKPGSRTETFAAVRLTVDSWRWAGVPFFIRAGKCLPLTATEVLVDLKRPPLSRLSPEDSNYFRFRLGPMVTISIGARIKKPGAEILSMPTELVAVHDAGRDEVDAYERLLTDAMKGDPTLFVREDAVEAAWAVVNGVLGDATPVHPYAPGTWGPAEASRMTVSKEGWHDPSATG